MRLRDPNIRCGAGIRSAFRLLEEKFPGYESRPQQLAMAGEVEAGFREKRNLLVEAGTGVGKSFAYLIPAIASEEKTVVSTASIALQDQLVKKDLAFLETAMPHAFSYGLLKGKNNYLCMKREREYAEFGDPFQRFREWARTTVTGDRDELDFIPEFWLKVCGDSEDCSASNCSFYQDCFYYRHYREIRKKDILVVNHHLLCYDLLSGFNILPFHNQIVIDEAHQLEQIISHVFGTVLNRSRVAWLLYRLKSLKVAVDHLVEPVEAFFRSESRDGRTITTMDDEVMARLKELKELLALERVTLRLTALRETVPGDGEKDRIGTTIGYAEALSRVIDDFIDREDEDRVYYLEAHDKGFELKSSLVECQGAFASLVGGYDVFVMTSATLTAGGNFAFFRERLGIGDETEKNGFSETIIDSPFDYRRQAMLYLEAELPPPGRETDDAYFREGLGKIERLIETSKGRALVLFTSYRHLRFVSRNINIGYPFRTQGDMPASRLVEWFRSTAGSVLLATTTFWQGIDVRGEKLSLVIIAKIPFGAPGDPVYDERCRRLGGRWFGGLALPSAILLLRQGFGRLIRGAGDRGVIAILDSRVAVSSYGSAIISSLPGMEITHDISDVGRFFAGLSVEEPVATPSRDARSGDQE